MYDNEIDFVNGIEDKLDAFLETLKLTLDSQYDKK